MTAIMSANTLVETPKPATESHNKADAVRSRRGESAPQRSISDHDLFWAIAVATAFSLDAVLLNLGALEAAASASPDESQPDVVATETTASGPDYAIPETAPAALQGDGGLIAALSFAGDAEPHAAEAAAVAAGSPPVELIGASGPALLLSPTGQAGDFEFFDLSSSGPAPLGDIYFLQTDALVSVGSAIALIGVEGDVFVETSADLISLEGAAIEVEADGAVEVSAQGALAGDHAAIDVASSGTEDVVITFDGAATAGAAADALAASVTDLKSALDTVAAALAERKEALIDQRAVPEVEAETAAETDLAPAPTEGLVDEAIETSAAFAEAEPTEAGAEPAAELAQAPIEAPAEPEPAVAAEPAPEPAPSPLETAAETEPEIAGEPAPEPAAEDTPVEVIQTQPIEAEPAEATAVASPSPSPEDAQRQAEAIEATLDAALEAEGVIEGDGLSLESVGATASLELSAPLAENGWRSESDAYLAELAEAVAAAVDAVVDSFDFEPEYVDGAIGQLANASAVGLSAGAAGGSVQVLAEGVIVASGDGAAVSSEGGAVEAEIDGTVVAGDAALRASGETVGARVDGALMGGETAVEVTAQGGAQVEIDGTARAVDGPAIAIEVSNGSATLEVDGEVRSGGGAAVDAAAAEDLKIVMEGLAQGGATLIGEVDAVRVEADGHVEIDAQGALYGGQVAWAGSAAAVAADEDMQGDVDLTIGETAVLEAGFIGAARDAAVKLGAGDDSIEIEGRVVGDVWAGGGDDRVDVEIEGVVEGHVVLGAGGDRVKIEGQVTGVVLLGDGDDRLELDEEGRVDGGVDGGRGADVFKAGDLADLFLMTFGAGSDIVEGFGFGDRFDFSALSDYNDGGAAALLEIAVWEDGDDVATLSFHDGDGEATLTLYGEEFDRVDFDDVFLWT